MFHYRYHRQPWFHFKTTIFYSEGNIAQFPVLASFSLLLPWRSRSQRKPACWMTGLNQLFREGGNSFTRQTSGQINHRSRVKNVKWHMLFAGKASLVGFSHRNNPEVSSNSSAPWMVWSIRWFSSSWKQRCCLEWGELSLQRLKRTVWVITAIVGRKWIVCNNKRLYFTSGTIYSIRKKYFL